jgi:hypothetical protein
LFEAACHMPPAFSQPAFVVYFAKSAELPDGLAAGEPEPPEAPGVLLVPLPDVPEPLVLPEVPEGVPELEPPDEPLPLLLLAAATAGARAMIPTKRVSINFCIVISSRYG